MQRGMRRGSLLIVWEQDDRVDGIERPIHPQRGCADLPRPSPRADEPTARCIGLPRPSRVKDDIVHQAVLEVRTYTASREAGDRCALVGVVGASSADQQLAGLILGGDAL